MTAEERNNNCKTRFELVYEALTTPDINGDVYSPEMAACLANSLLVCTESTMKRSVMLTLTQVSEAISPLTSKVERLKEQLHKLR